MMRDANLMTEAPPGWAVLIRRFALFTIVWLILTHGAPDGWGFGLVAAAAATALSRRLWRSGRSLRFLPLAAHAPHFMWRSLVGGLDVAWRALSPRMPLQPGWIVYPTDLPAGARVALGGEVSLLPGTLVAGSRGNGLLVHSLNSDRPIAESLADEERRICEMLGLDWKGRLE